MLKAHAGFYEESAYLLHLKQIKDGSFMDCWYGLWYTVRNLIIHILTIDGLSTINIEGVGRSPRFFIIGLYKQHNRKYNICLWMLFD